MAMLAEPRRKTKWTLNPRGKLWSDDSNKFGQKMLEKMGWKEGKGLGANEQGMTSHIHVKLKSDNAGVGFKGKDTDWCRHQAEFENILANLSGSVEEVENEAQLESLEKRSKASKVRLHYHKFTRGKDVSMYSQKDLECILGVQEEKFEAECAEDTPMTEGIGTIDDSYGVKTIIGGNIEDYLKQKQTLGTLKIHGKAKGAGCKDSNSGKKRKEKKDLNVKYEGGFASSEGGNELHESCIGEEVKNAIRKKRKKLRNEKGSATSDGEGILGVMRDVNDSVCKNNGISKCSVKSDGSDERDSFNVKPKKKKVATPECLHIPGFTEEVNEFTKNVKSVVRSEILENKMEGLKNGEVMGMSEELPIVPVDAGDFGVESSLCEGSVIKEEACRRDVSSVKRKKKGKRKCSVDSQLSEGSVSAEEEMHWGCPSKRAKKTKGKRSKVEGSGTCIDLPGTVTDAGEGNSRVFKRSVESEEVANLDGTRDVSIVGEAEVCAGGLQVGKSKEMAVYLKEGFHSCLKRHECDRKMIQLSSKMFHGASLFKISGYGKEL